MPREKSITDLKDERTQLSIRAKAITDGARAEKRMLNEGENTELGEIQCRMTDINMEIATKEAENRGKGTPHVEPGQERFSLRRSLANYISGQGQHDADASVIEAATRLHNSAGVTRSSQNSLVIPMSLEKRAMFTAATESATGVVIDQEQQELLLPLQSSLVLAQAGARFMTGLQGDIYWPKYSGSNVFWEG